MTHHRRAEAIFLALADLTPAERAAAIREQCGEDAALRAEVEALVAALDAPDAFLDPDQIPSLDPDSVDGPLQPGTRLGDFLVLHALGSGGMGVVYAAQQDRPRRTVAIKVLRRGVRHQEILRRFELEAEVLARLQHPGIAQVYAFQSGDRATPAYLVMELVPGPPITEYAQAHALPFMARVEMAAKLCDAVQHAHERGVIHRDLKPANVLVAEDGRPKVLDFGIARATGLDLQLSTIRTMHGQLVGTLAFMSPEQLRAVPDDVDARSDVYALGVLIYRLLAERLPFDLAGVPFAEAMRRVLEDDPLPLGLADADLRGPLEHVISRAMARDRGARYQSAAALAADLRAYVAGQPITAGDPRVGTLRRQVQRYQRAAATTAAAVLVLAAFAGYALVERRRANEVAARLETELGTSRIERGRLVAVSGSLPAAEALIWPEYFRRTNKDYPRWALRELYSHQPALWTAAAHTGAARVARFVAGDTRLLTGGDDGAIVVWSAESGERLVRIDAHRGAVRAIADVPGRGAIVSGGADGAVRLWRLSDGTGLHEWTPGRAGVRSIDVSPDGSRIAATDEAGAVRLWRTDGDLMDATVARPGATSWIARFDPAGRRLFVGWDDGTVEVRDAASLAPLGEVHAHDGNASSLAFSPDGRLVATGSADRTARVWNAATLERVARLDAANGTARSVAFAPDGRTLAVAGWWRVDLWNTRSWTRVEPALGRAEGWFDAEFSHNGSYLATAGEGGSVRVWETRPHALESSRHLADGPAADRAVVAMKGPAPPDLAALASRLGGAHGELLAAAHATDSDDVFVSGRDGKVVRWSPTPGREEWAVSTKDPAFALAASPDGHLVAAGLWTGAVALLDAASGARIATLPGHVRVVRGLAFSDNSRLLASAGSDGALHLWNVPDGLLLITPAERAVGASRVVFLAAGRVAVAWDDGRVDVVNTQYFDRHVRGNEAYQRARLGR